MRADGGERVLLARNAREPAWSADGRLAFVRDGAIWTMNAGGSDQRRLTAVLGDAAKDSGPAWSPDSRSLAFTRVGVRDGPSHHAIWVMSADGSSAHAIVEGSAQARVSSPAWSPDGQLIAFTRVVAGKRGEPSDSAIYTVRTDGSDARRLSERGSRDSAPAWSPDGSHIAFLGLGDRNGRSCAQRCSPHAEIYLMRADGTGIQRLTRTRADEGRPAWSDDSAAMVFDQQPSGGVSRVVALLVESGCSGSLRAARDRDERFRHLAWQPASGASLLRCDQPLAPARATFVGIPPVAVATEIRGGRAAERALARRLLAGLGRNTGIAAVRIGPPPGRRQAGLKKASIWLRFDVTGRGGRRVSAVRPSWEAGLMADAYQRAAAAGLAPRPLLGHTLHFAGGTAISLPQSRRAHTRAGSQRAARRVVDRLGSRGIEPADRCRNREPAVRPPPRPVGCPARVADRRPEELRQLQRVAQRHARTAPARSGRAGRVPRSLRPPGRVESDGRGRGSGRAQGCAGVVVSAQGRYERPRDLPHAQAAARVLGGARAEWEGFEPSSRVDPDYAISNRAP